MRAAKLALLTLAIVFALMAASAFALISTYRTQQIDREIVFVIPEGAAAREARGEGYAMLPKVITLTIGLRDTLIIRNDDGFVARVGGFKLEAGQRWIKQFTRPGPVDVVCTTIFHNEEMRVYVVEDPNPLRRWVNGLFED